MPVVEEELLLTNAQQACHQGIQSLWRTTASASKSMRRTSSTKVQLVCKYAGQTGKSYLYMASPTFLDDNDRVSVLRPILMLDKYRKREIQKEREVVKMQCK